MDKAKLRDRIRALREKTTSKGCTEAEAMAAASKAAELMRKAGLSELDLEMSESESQTQKRGQSVECHLWRVISACTNTSSILLDKEDGMFVRFLGKEPGPEIATYLWTVCDRAIRKEVQVFKVTSFYRRRRSISTKRQAVSDFKTGMVARLGNRLLGLFEDIRNDEERAQAAQALCEQFPNLVDVKRRNRKFRYGEAASHGYAAGARVNLSHGVAGQGNSPDLIGTT
ncbi:conserved hypothetical protein [Roseibium sp. TrichSKD4]|uniref:DUF7168 domain-containing protein n=1 Tax=Roseibium sp. TrichSKD4 TaxID=744980 RepID=UPI0001E57617|nr:DUF2786 domain-containing protein [Roseibium sp. TrichSKD4]EFO30958.1 conserved hypothetical protein [Roseibium sp. TrichSKD4]